MAVIALRHEFATGGRELGKLIANRLGYRFADKYIFQNIANDLAVSENALKSYEINRHAYLTNLFLKLVPQKYLKRIARHDLSIVCEKEYRKTLKKLILSIARDSNVVILGRASCYFLRNEVDCYCFRIFAPMEWRLKHAVEELKIPEKMAQKITKIIS